MDRYQSMEQLKLDLNKILEGKDLNALPYLNLNENRGQANSNETLWLTGKNDSSTGRHGQSTDRGHCLSILPERKTSLPAPPVVQPQSEERVRALPR
ncbi:MAG: hypothetical protein IPP97_08780 [Candidatus Obscuribacter sp.]|nr:hypothetical protein [Candidatus Obscuribacter sp.]